MTYAFSTPKESQILRGDEDGALETLRALEVLEEPIMTKSLRCLLAFDNFLWGPSLVFNWTLSGDDLERT